MNAIADFYDRIKTKLNLADSEDVSGLAKTLAEISCRGPASNSIAKRFQSCDMNKVLEKSDKVIDSAKDIGFKTVQGIKDFVKSGAGKVVTRIKSLGKIPTEYGYKIFNKGARIANPIPTNGKFARVMPKRFVEDLKAGNARFSRIDPNDPTINEAFIASADDLAGLTKGDDIVKKLSLYSDEAGTVYRKLDPTKDVIVEFKFKGDVMNSLRSPTETANNLRNYGFVPGGKTGGGAREWLVDGDAAKKGYIDLDSINVRNVE